MRIASLGALLADLGQQVLLIDADPQPTLSSYYRLAVVAPHGLTDLMVTADTEATVSQTGIERLHLVYSDDPDGRLCDWIRDAVDGRVRLKHILQRLDGVLTHPHRYQGAVGPLAVAAAVGGLRALSRQTTRLEPAYDLFTRCALPIGF